MTSRNRTGSQDEPYPQTACRTDHTGKVVHSMVHAMGLDKFVKADFHIEHLKGRSLVWVLKCLTRLQRSVKSLPQ